MGYWGSQVIPPPCQGGDREFESRITRCATRRTNIGRGSSGWGCSSDKRVVLGSTPKLPTERKLLYKNGPYPIGKII